MNLAKILPLSAVLLTAALASAQYGNQYPQPYNSQDPQNYGAPASQSYSQQQSGYPQQQGGYPQQQSGYPQQQGGYPQQQGGYPQQQGQQRYDPDAYDQGGDGQYSAQDDQNYYNGQQAIDQAPPALPNYDQPEAPGDGYEWTPGYWAFGTGGYSWVPGAWVEPPYVGALWTPGYWGYGGGGYFWNAGYWGNTIGFYGGINYGFGYFGTGFYGGYWNGGRFFYNRAYWNVGGGRFFYNQPFRGVGGVHPGGGRSFATVNAHGEAFRGGAYNQHGFAAQREGQSSRGFNNSQGLNTNHAFAGQQGGAYRATPAQGFSGNSARQPYTGGNYGGSNRGAMTQQARPAQNLGATRNSYTRATPSYSGSQGYHSAPSYSGGGATSSHAASSGGGGGGNHGGGHR